MDGAHDLVTHNYIERGSSSSIDAEERCLWEKCNRLLQSEKKFTLPYVLGTMIHITALILVTNSTVNLANENYRFRQYWIDLQEGYYSLLLKDYATTLHYPNEKYVYTSQVKIMSTQREMIDYLQYAYHRYDKAETISLGEVTKARYNTGFVVHPKLCVTKQSSVNIQSDYTTQYNTGAEYGSDQYKDIIPIVIVCTQILDVTDINKEFNGEINSTNMILMQFQFKQVYLVEGHKPLCIQLTVHYSIKNDFQYYLWPIRITVKGRLINCSDRGFPNERYFILANRNILLAASVGVLTMLLCFIGCVFHCIRMVMFIVTGKMVRDYATKKKLSKPLWRCFPQKLQIHFWWISDTRNCNYRSIPLKAYVIFFPLLHVLDIVFLLLSTCGIVLEFTTLRTITTTDKFIHHSTVVSFILGLCSTYFWCTSFRLFNHSKSAGVTIRSLINTKATKVLLYTVVIIAFAYVGITLLAWVILGIFHPNFSTFGFSAETFFSLTYGDRLIYIGDNLLPQYPQNTVFIASRVICGAYCIMFPILLVSVIIAIISVAVEEKWQLNKHIYNDLVKDDTFTWKVLLKWVTTYPPAPFPGTNFDLAAHKAERSNNHHSPNYEDFVCSQTTNTYSVA